MSENSGAQGGGNSLVDLIIAVIVIVVLIVLFKYIWQGMTWAFNEYVDLLKVN